MKSTFFAKAERSSDGELQGQLVEISRNPVVDGLLETVSGLMAILNENRHIITTNEALLELLEIDNLTDILGLRPGAGHLLHETFRREIPGRKSKFHFIAR